MDDHGKWFLAPAYDLTFSFSSGGFHSTTIAGEGQNPRKEHLLKLAHLFGVKNPEIIINEVKTIVSNWPHYASEAGWKGIRRTH
ncbi:MAG: hypothetical protein R3B93_05525 [Bacteroidia bacterium]